MQIKKLICIYSFSLPAARVLLMLNKELTRRKPAI